MIRINDIDLPLEYTDEMLAEKAAKAVGIKRSDISVLRLVRRSVDARKKNNVHFTASVAAEVRNESSLLRKFPANKISIYKEADHSVPHKSPVAHRPVRGSLSCTSWTFTDRNRTRQ